MKNEPLKVIIAGGRDFFDRDLLFRTMDHYCETYDVVEIVSGEAHGADKLGMEFALSRGYPIQCFPADWGKFGRSAGPRRNRLMAEYANALVAFWDGKSRGTKNMIDEATKLGLKVNVINY